MAEPLALGFLSFLAWLIGAAASLSAFVFAAWFMIRVARDVRRIANAVESSATPAVFVPRDVAVAATATARPRDARVVNSAFGR